MPTYVARIDAESGTLLEREDVTVEILTDGSWRARFLLAADGAVTDGSLARGDELELAFADGRHGRARVDHIHAGSSNRGPRLVELVGISPLG